MILKQIKRFFVIAFVCAFFYGGNLIPAQAASPVHLHNHAYLPTQFVYYICDTDPTFYMCTASPNASEYMYEMPDADIAGYVNQLKQYSIETQYADIGAFDSTTGTIPDSRWNRLGHWIKVSHQTDPTQKVVGWLNANKAILTGSESVKTNIINHIQNLVYTGALYNGVYYKVDGIHLDIEPFNADDPNLLAFMSRVKAILPPGFHFSVDAPASSSTWSNTYISQMAALVTQINIMIYDTGMKTSSRYIPLYKNTVLRYSSAIAASGNPSCQLSPIMPSYGKSRYHDPNTENIHNASTALLQAIAGGANVYSSGIFWWGTFRLTNPDPFDGHDYTVDQGWWLNDWVNHS